MKTKMTNRQRRDAELAYISDDSIFEEQLVCRAILQKLNFMDRSDFAGIGEVVKELLGNLCKVIRKITDEDKRKLFRDGEIDEEAWQDMLERMEFC